MRLTYRPLCRYASLRALRGRRLAVREELETFIENGNRSISARTSEHNNRDRLSAVPY